MADVTRFCDLSVNLQCRIAKVLSKMQVGPYVVEKEESLEKLKGRLLAAGISGYSSAMDALDDVRAEDGTEIKDD